MRRTHLLAGAIAISLGGLPSAYGLDPPSSQDQFTQQASSDGGTGAEQNITERQSHPAKDQKNSDQNAQVTLGGAKPLVSGEIRKIEREYFFIKEDEAGDEVRLLVTEDANLDCSAAPTTRAASASQNVGTMGQTADEGRASNDRQKEQGQKSDETAVGSGFRIGSCSFKPGDRIRAEVDDMGRVTTLKFMLTREGPLAARSLGESAGTGELAIPGKQEKPGQLDMTGPQGYPPKEYAVPPVPLGELKSVKDNSVLHSPVKDADGNVIGSIESVLMDSHTGQTEYAVVLLDDSKRLEAVPWARLKQMPNQTKLEFILNTTQYQLSPAPEASNDRSLEVGKLLEDVRATLRAESRNPEGAPAKIEILMQDKGYHVKGNSHPDSLTAIVLRNQDTETHGFSSPLFQDVVIRKEGDAIEVKENGVWSYHVPPGKTAILYFTQASHVDPSTGIRETMQYPFQCDLHPNMKGELLVVETRGEMGGG